MASDRPPIASVEEVRDALKRLGYLDSGLDRFVLAGAGGPSLLATSLGVAWRVGLAAGPLLGAALTVATLGLDPRLLAEPRDVFILAVYAALVLGLAAAVAAFVGGLVVAGFGKRLGPTGNAWLARGVALALALGGLVYAALWWRTHGLGAPLLTQATALLAALGLSVVLSRFGSLAAVAVLSARERDGLPEVRLSRRHVLSAVGLAAVVCAAGVALSYSAERAAGEPTDYAVVPTGLHVRVLGIDGLEQRMTEQMLARGEMPHLARLLAAGARARLRAEPERVPAIVWTTIATGRGPEAHGIQSAGGRRLAGMRTAISMDSAGGRILSALGEATDRLRLTRSQPPTSVLRGVKTFWNVASEKGLRVGIVNWWATWPAEAVNGFVVSDRAFFKIDHGGAPDREVFPPGDFERLSSLAGSSKDDVARRLDRFAEGAANALRPQAPLDVEAVYLPGLDIFTSQTMGVTAGADLAALEARLAGVRAYYRFVDDRIGAASDEGGQGVLVLVGDPGRLAREGGDSPEGLLLLAGGPVVAADLGNASERDVAPTVLHLVGLPTSRELEGRVLEAALSPAFRKSHPVRVVATLGRPPAVRSAESAFDPQMIEELRSLGYIK